MTVLQDTLLVCCAGLLSLGTPLATITGEPTSNWSDYPATLNVGLHLAIWDHAGEFEPGPDVLLAHVAAGLRGASRSM